jgi:hypothetical protein
LKLSDLRTLWDNVIMWTMQTRVGFTCFQWKIDIGLPNFCILSYFSIFTRHRGFNVWLVTVKLSGYLHPSRPGRSHLIGHWLGCKAVALVNRLHSTPGGDDWRRMHAFTYREELHEQPSESPFHACTYYKQAIWQACSMCCWTFTTLFFMFETRTWTMFKTKFECFSRALKLKGG